MAAGHLRDVEAAQTAADGFNAMVEATKKSDKPHQAKYMANNHDEAQAWLAFAQGKNDDALRLLRAVADKQDKVGKGETETPAREMLADMLLELHQPVPALDAYETVLKIAPNRFNALYGAAAAAEMAGDSGKAKSYYSKLRENCPPQADRQELQKARMVAAESR